MDIATLEQRSADALKAYTDFVTPLIESGAARTDEQRSTQADLKAKADQANDNLTEARSIEAREVETRGRHKAAEARRTGVSADVSVTNEQPIYHRSSRHSWFVDRAFAAGQGPRAHAARERLASHEQQMSSLLVNGSDEARQIESYVMAENRNDPDNGEAVLNAMRSNGVEQRSGVTTATGSAGAFVPPVYLDRIVQYNQPGRVFLDAVGVDPLPESGLTINLPVIGGPAGVGTKAQNAAVPETDPTTSDLPITVQPVWGGMTVSVEAIERNAYGGQFDTWINRSLVNAYNQQADAIALTAILAGATTQAYTGTFAMATANTNGGFYGQVNQAIASINTAAGVMGNPDLMFVTPGRWAKIAAWADGNARPLIVPAQNGPQNAVAVGQSNRPQGLVGTTMSGLSVYKDPSIPLIAGTPQQDQAIVLDSSLVVIMEAGPTFEVFPATLANTGSVYFRLHSYLAAAAPQPAAVVAINGTAMGIS